MPVIERLERATFDDELLRKVELEQDYIDRDRSKNQQLKEALEREKSLQHNFAKIMLKHNAPIEEIVKETGLTEDEIKKLI